MYINFQQNWINRAAKTVHTNIFANNLKLHTFATTNNNFEKIVYFTHASSYNVDLYQFSAKSHRSDQLFAKIVKLHALPPNGHF